MSNAINRALEQRNHTFIKVLIDQFVELGWVDEDEDWVALLLDEIAQGSFRNDDGSISIVGDGVISSGFLVF